LTSHHGAIGSRHAGDYQTRDRLAPVSGALWASAGRGALRVSSIFVSLWALLCYLAAFSSANGPFLGLACWVIGSWISTLIHESGHAAAVRACGWRVLVFVVRPFGLQIPNRNLFMARRSQRPGAGGWVSMVPRSQATGTRARLAIIVAAGPLASLVVAMVAMVGSPLWLAASDRHDLRVSLIGFAFGVQALHGGLFSLLPHMRVGGNSDGDILRLLRRVDARWDALRPLAWLRGLQESNVRLRELPHWMLDAARAIPLPPDGLAQHMATIEIGIVLDSVPVDAVLARRLIDEYRALHGSSEWLDSCDAYLTAMWEADSERARDALWKGAVTINDMRPLALAAKAAVAARAGEVSVARKLLADMRSALKAKSPLRDATFSDIGRQIEALLA
jgi:hypothetical protein